MRAYSTLGLVHSHRCNGMPAMGGNGVGMGWEWGGKGWEGVGRGGKGWEWGGKGSL